jgi:1-deoxy-D-xylulose-5-phosphate synthase
MPSGSSLKFMMDALPERAFDVELLNSTPLRCQLEWRPKVWLFFATSTPLLQRGYDQVIHDVAIQTRYFCLDRAGLVGRRRNPSRRF